MVTICACDYFVICCEAGFRDLLRFGFGYTNFVLYQKDRSGVKNYWEVNIYQE